MFELKPNVIYRLEDADGLIDEARQNGISTTNKKINYYNIVCAFDIETTSFEDHDEDKGDPKRGIMYIWQFAINGRVIIGRTWDEFIDLIIKLELELDLNLDNRLIIYIHNLNFEFQFLRKYFRFHNVFSIDTRKPIYAVTTGGIEFRCSYILTNYSLAKLGEQLQKYKVSKMVGDLDYSLPRHEKTQLTDEELQYCINDVLVISAYIQEQIEIEGNITEIPLTATGYCRRYVRHECLYSGGKKYKRKHYAQYIAKMRSMKISGVEEYEQLQRAFQGGFTHANAKYVSWNLKNVDSIDFCSSYPYVCLSECEFPMSSGQLVKITSSEELNKYLKCYCCIFDVEFEYIESTFDNEQYISYSKCRNISGEVVNNGRVRSAYALTTTITNIDFEIIKKTYKFKVAHIYNFRIYKKGYLPIEIIRSIIHFYKAKTELKGVKGKETEYLNGKALLNAVYGMMVTSIVRDEIIYNDDLSEWNTKEADAEKLIQAYNNSRKRFLFFPWGIFVTALARRNLWTGILHFGDDYIYADTDSIKCLHLKKHLDFVNSYNALCEQKLRKMCEYYGLVYEDELLPKTIKGEVKPIGVFDHDGHYDIFKTLGAKRYMVCEDGKLSLTVSGVNKNVAVPYLTDLYSIEECFDAFNFGLEIPPIASGKLTHYYIDDEHEGYITDYEGVRCKYKTLSGIYLEPAEYSFDMASEYLDYLKGYRLLKL